MSENNGPHFDFKANYLNFLLHKPTTLIPNAFVGNKIMGFGSLAGPWIEKGNQFGDGYDAFGVKWIYPASGGGAAIPDNHLSCILDDICDWREKIHIPNPANYDWKSFFEGEARILGSPDREHEIVDFGFGNGVFERLASLMTFEGALIAIATEPEEVEAFLTAVTDYKVAALDYIIDAYHPDTITYYDDVATEQALFISPDTYRALIKPQHKRFAQECIKRGVMPIYHCCGHAEAIVEDMIDCGWVAWTSVQPSNDICGLIEKYGDRFGFMGGYDTTGDAARVDSTQEQVDAEVGRCLTTYGKYHKAYAFFGFRAANSLDPADSAKSMGMLVSSCMQQSMALLMEGK